MEEAHVRKPLVSVIMPAYNAAEYIAESILSVQNQTMSDWELIVLDDCSTDTTALVVDGLAQSDSRICLHQSNRNMGVARSRNRGLDLCRGDYIAFLDSDDVWRAEKLETQLRCIQQTGADLVYTSYGIVNSDGRSLYNNFIVPTSVDFSCLLKENVIGCSTVMLSAVAAKNYRFAETVYHEDYVLWLEMLRSGCKAVGIQQVLMEYRVHVDSKAGNKQKAARKRWQVYRCYLHFSVMKSVWYFVNYALAGLCKYRKVKNKTIKE